MAGQQKHFAQAAAVWTAVGRWSMACRPDGLPDYAVSEMLAHARRRLAGKPTKPLADYYGTRDAAEPWRKAWENVGCPGMIPAFACIDRFIHHHRSNCG